MNLFRYFPFEPAVFIASYFAGRYIFVIVDHAGNKDYSQRS